MAQKDECYTPLLRTIGRTLAGLGPVLGDHVGIMLPHFLPNLRGLLASFRAIGLAPERTWLLFKDYRYPGKDRLIADLQRLGYNVRHHRDLETSVDEAMACARSRSCELLVVEDGAHVLDYVHRMGSLIDGVKVRAVEQTENGHSRIESLLPALRAHVVSVARSRMKAQFESPHVARSVIQNVGNLLHNRGLEGKHVATIGYGTIGRHICLEARRTGMVVTVFDNDERRLARAHCDGFPTASSARDAIHNAWLIIGTTGTTSIGEEIFSALGHGCHLANAASGNHEIDLPALRQHAQKICVDERATEYFLEPDRRRITVLAHGWPLNFHDYTAVPDEIIDMVLAALLVSAWEAVAMKFCCREIHAADPFIEKHRLIERYYRLYAARKTA